MSLLRELLLDKKIFEAQEDIDEFLEEASLDEGMVPQRMEFDRKIFEDKDQVNDFMVAHLFSSHKIEDEDKKKFVVTFFDQSGFIDDTMKSVVIRDGVVIVVGFLRPMSSDNPFFFKITDSSIKFSGEVPHIIELANVVDGFHPAFGQVKITQKDLISFKNNFENNVVGVDIMLDFDHETRGAAGWLNEVFLSIDGNTLLGVVKWTPKGALSLSDREFRYFSPEFNLNWIHPHTGVSHGPTLLGGALVNRPFLKMEAIVASNKNKLKGAKEMDTISLSDHKEKVGGLDKEIVELKLSVATMKNTFDGVKTENVKLADELKTLNEKNAKAKKEATHKKLFDGGKINAAQLTALNEGKDALDVLSLSAKLNTEAGGGGGGVEVVIQLSAKEVKLCKQLGLSPEDYIKYNKEEAE